MSANVLCAQNHLSPQSQLFKVVICPPIDIDTEMYAQKYQRSLTFGEWNISTHFLNSMANH